MPFEQKTYLKTSFNLLKIKFLINEALVKMVILLYLTKSPYTD